ncbi:MAG: hypothetical protein EAX89_17215 [Candidatus Lokiarchaeota archaeon]|nr:hypothetical protein [Candidatus Lokiarchaeota archaeon]
MEDHFANIWYLEDKNERIKMIETKEQLILSKRKHLNMNPNSNLLYGEAKSCFVEGNFISATLTFYLATEQYLLWSNQHKKGNVLEILQWPKVGEILNEALENNSINIEIKKELEFFIKGCRDEIMHSKSLNQLHIVGLVKDKDPEHPRTFGGKGHPNVYLGPLGCAKRALDLFYKIIEFNTHK